MFFQAAGAGNKTILEVSLDAGIDVNTVAHDGSTALHCAARAGQTSIITYLIEQGADTLSRNQKVRMPLDEAILSRNAETVRALLHSSVILEAENGTTLCIVRSGSVDILNLYMNHLGARFSAKAKYNMLLVASKHGQVSIIARLLSLPTDSNDSDCTKEDRWLAGRMLPWAQQPDDRMYTPLHIAALRGDLKTTQLLVRHGFKVDVTTRGNQTPSLLAAQGGYMDVLRFLLCQKGVDVNRTARLGRGRTLLHIAVQSRQIEMVKLLLDRADVDVNCKEHITHGRTLLHIAVQSGQIKIVKLLLDRVDVDVNRKEYMTHGQTPLDIAVRFGQIEMAKLLLVRADLDVNCKNNREGGRTPLHIAVLSRQIKMVKLLLDRTDVDVNCRDMYQRTPLHLASVRGDLALLQMLLRHERIELSGQDDSGLSALDLSAIYGQWDIVQALLDHDEYGGAQTHVVQALEPHRIPPSDIVKRLLSHRNFRDINVLGPSRDDLYHHIGGLLHIAVRQGDCDILRVLLNRKEINVDCQSAYKRKTPLHLAAKLGRMEIVELLLQHERISVNLRTSDSYAEEETALHIARRKGHAELAELLLAHGAIE